MNAINEFISVDIDLTACIGINQCGNCVGVCPVGIFQKGDDRPSLVQKQMDECILCDLCLQVCDPGAIVIEKLYET